MKKNFTLENNFPYYIFLQSLALELKTLAFLTLLTISCFVNIAFADGILPIPIDNRMKTLVYSPNEVFRLKFKVGYQSHIVFPPDESPVLQTFGDSRGWSIKLVGTSMFIKPMDPGLSTNMIIETNKDRVYYFEVSSTFNADGEDDDFAYRVNFYYPQKAVDVPALSINRGIIDGDIQTPLTGRVNAGDAGMNFGYSFSGESGELKPIKVFDNGNKTYMLFPNNNEKVPSIYAVDLDGKEHLLKYSIKNSYVELDTTEYQFSLRMGGKLICVFNEVAMRAKNVR